MPRTEVTLRLARKLAPLRGRQHQDRSCGRSWRSRGRGGVEQPVGYFSQETLDELTKGIAELPPALRKLKAAGRAFANDQAREHAQHGLCRRLSTMVHMVQTVFELLPPDQGSILENVTVMDADLFAFSRRRRTPRSAPSTPRRCL
jgi:hypothetical protein